MQLSPDQFRQLARERVQSRARHWSARIDQAVEPADRQAPEARLAALAQAVRRELPAGAVFEAADVAQATHTLTQTLQAGVPWSDTRAAAQLHAAAGLGALWYQDDRLLAAEDQLQPEAGQGDALPALLAQAQGQRFKRAARRAHLLGPGLRMALQRALPEQCPDTALQQLISTAFSPTDDTPEAPADVIAREAAEAGDAPDWQPAARAFVTRERALQAEAGLTDPLLTRLCMAGDLTLGLGRCVRLLAAQATCPPQQSIDFLSGALHATTQHQL